MKHSSVLLLVPVGLFLAIGSIAAFRARTPAAETRAEVASTDAARAPSQADVGLGSVAHEQAVMKSSYCASCHPDAYAEHEQNTHGRAFTDEEVRLATGRAVEYGVEAYPGAQRLLRRAEGEGGQRGPGAACGFTDVPERELPAGYKRVLWYALDVHHFAFSLNPDYRYEGGRAGTNGTLIHVLYRPGDEKEWGNGIAVQRTAVALAWLEHLFGPFAWPQITNLRSAYRWVQRDGQGNPLNLWVRDDGLYVDLGQWFQQPTTD